MNELGANKSCRCSMILFEVKIPPVRAVSLSKWHLRDRGYSATQAPRSYQATDLK